MFVQICKRSLLFISNRGRVLVNSNAHLGPRQFYTAKSSSAGVRDDEQERSFTVNYLVNSCFLTLEAAKSVSKKIHFEKPKKPDLVLNLLKDHGFTRKQISTIIRVRPQVLVSDAEKTLLPKLEFFRSKHVSSSDVTMVVAGNPNILCVNLEKNFFPCYDFLKSVVGSDQRVFTLLRRSRWHSSLLYLEKFLLPNVLLMREIGLPESSISLLLLRKPFLVCHATEKLDKIIREVLNMGVNPLKVVFIDGLEVIHSLSKLSWERKMEAYRSWGLSDDQILAAFRKSPKLMALSEKKISRVMGFFVNEMGWTSSVVAEAPIALSYSLEKRIIPRFLVLKALLLKGIIAEKDFSICTILLPDEKRFLDRFVIKYQKQAPQLMSIFREKVGHQELGSRYEEVYS
ncbi:uncharacterized protein LOC120000722 [Tripterygium wilfordii]|uniref:uncharacterized protein LOC120000722 n=1 Tax=Tripterygium wilfordii TaxID=458696 RepID=UPI0018F8178B|nr:uncharacterized protein LOC120000722 [Tripterygium wilfordii]